MHPVQYPSSSTSYTPVKEAMWSIILVIIHLLPVDSNIVHLLQYCTKVHFLSLCTLLEYFYFFFLTFYFNFTTFERQI